MLLKYDKLKVAPGGVPLEDSKSAEKIEVEGQPNVKESS